MIIHSTGIKDGYFLAKYGGNGTEFNQNGMPTYSIPFSIEAAPAGTQSFAAVLYDLDSYPVTKGFVWFHWLLANLTTTEIPENASQKELDFVQGVNSWHSPLSRNQNRVDSSFYGGMTPPDSDHTYTLKVFALDTCLNLASGFYLNELTNEMRGHILATAELEAKYQKIESQKR